MFVLGAFVLATVVQELWRGTAARRASAAEAPPVALVRLIRRNRRRYGGYIVHGGLAVLLIGVAGSSSFQHSNQVTLAPGQHARVDGYTITYIRPVATASAAKLTFGSVLDVTKGGRRVAILTTTRSFYPATDSATAGPISEAFNGGSDSNVGLQAGLTHDIWTVVNPDLTPLAPLIRQGDSVFLQFMTKLTPAQARDPSTIRFISAYRARAIGELTQRFVTHPWPVAFLLIVSPLVSWIWLGALIIVAGGLIALWPVPATARRGATVRSAARRRPAPAVAARETV
jgi:cytochrome c-type biogenesis protein CcmF